MLIERFGSNQHVPKHTACCYTAMLSLVGCCFLRSGLSIWGLFGRFGLRQPLAVIGGTQVLGANSGGQGGYMHAAMHGMCSCNNTYCLGW